MDEPHKNTVEVKLKERITLYDTIYMKFQGGVASPRPSCQWLSWKDWWLGGGKRRWRCSVPWFGYWLRRVHSVKICGTADVRFVHFSVFMLNIKKKKEKWYWSPCSDIEYGKMCWPCYRERLMWYIRLTLSGSYQARRTYVHRKLHHERVLLNANNGYLRVRFWARLFYFFILFCICWHFYTAYVWF